MKSSLCLFGILVFLVTATTLHGETEIEIKNSWNQDIEVKLFSESEQAWLKPSLKIKSGKSAKLKLNHQGDHNVKLIADGNREFLLGTFDLQKIIKDKNIDVIEFAAVSRPVKVSVKDIDFKKLKKGDIVETEDGKMRVEFGVETITKTKMRTETRTRMVSITLGTGEVRQVPQTYTIQVPYTEAIEVQKPRLVPVAGGKVTTRNTPGIVFKSKGKKVEVKDVYGDKR